VVGASCWVDGNRIGATGYFWKSVSESMVCSNVTAPLLKELTTVYSKLRPHRRHWNPSTFEVAIRMDVTWTPITSAFRIILIPWVSFYDVVAAFLANSNTFYVLIVYLTSLIFSAKIKQASTHCSFTLPAFFSTCFICPCCRS
jgi:hypothetical protein